MCVCVCVVLCCGAGCCVVLLVLLVLVLLVLGGPVGGKSPHTDSTQFSHTAHTPHSTLASSQVGWGRVLLELQATPARDALDAVLGRIVSVVGTVRDVAR